MPQKQYRTNFPVQPDAKVACWYGEKEGHMKKRLSSDCGRRDRGRYATESGKGNTMKVTTLDEKSIHDIGHAFGYYDYGEETGMAAAFSGKEATAN